MLSKQFKDAVFYQDQFLTKESIEFDKCRIEYVFDNVNDRYDTVTAIVNRLRFGDVFVFYAIDKNYVRYDEEDIINWDDDDDVTEDIFDCYGWDIFSDLDSAIISVMHDCPDEDVTFRPNFNTYSEMISFYEKMKNEGLVSNIEEFLTEQICDDFKQDLESTLSAYNAGVPLEDILVDD